MRILLMSLVVVSLATAPPGSEEQALVDRLRVPGRPAA